MSYIFAGNQDLREEVKLGSKENVLQLWKLKKHNWQNNSTFCHINWTVQDVTSEIHQRGILTKLFKYQLFYRMKFISVPSLYMCFISEMYDPCWLTKLKSEC